MKVALLIELPEELHAHLRRHLEANPLLNQDTVLEAAIALYLAQNATLSEAAEQELWAMYWDAQPTRPAQAWQTVGAGVGDVANHY